MSKKIGKYYVSDKLVGLSQIYSRGKTHVPKEVRVILNVKDGDKLRWYMKDQELIVTRNE